MFRRGAGEPHPPPGQAQDLPLLRSIVEAGLAPALGVGGASLQHISLDKNIGRDTIPGRGPRSRRRSVTVQDLREHILWSPDYRQSHHPAYPDPWPGQLAMYW